MDPLGPMDVVPYREMWNKDRILSNIRCIDSWRSTRRSPPTSAGPFASIQAIELQKVESMDELDPDLMILPK